jgi:predicted DNA-binding ribbon-helix-helix protein
VTGKGGKQGSAFSGPVKRSMMIAGHATSISLEPVFWAALRQVAAAEELPLNALVARIDAERIQAKNPPNLGSAIRVWLFERATSSPSGSDGEGDQARLAER